ncbi:MAG: taxilin [archaeon]|nr:taxilin [archaeon]
MTKHNKRKQKGKRAQPAPAGGVARSGTQKKGAQAGSASAGAIEDEDIYSIAMALGVSPSKVDRETLSLLIEADAHERGHSAEGVQALVEARMSQLQQAWVQESEQERELFDYSRAEERQLKQRLEEAATITDKLRVLHHRCLKLLNENEKHAREVLLLRQGQEADALAKESLHADLAASTSMCGQLESLCLDLQTYGPFDGLPLTSRPAPSSSSSSAALPPLEAGNDATPSSAVLVANPTPAVTSATPTASASPQAGKGKRRSNKPAAGKNPSSVVDTNASSFSSTSLVSSAAAASLVPTLPSPVMTVANRATQLQRQERDIGSGSGTELGGEKRQALLGLRQLLTTDLEESLFPADADAAPELSPEEEIEMWRGKAANLLEMYRLRERHFAAIMRRSDLEHQLLESKLKYQFNVATQEALRSQAYKEQITTLGKTERTLRSQLSTYAEKFEQFQTTLTKSNDVFTAFKQEMQKMTKTIQKLEKENAALKKRSEQADSKLSGLTDERNRLQKDLSQAHQRTTKLEQICRALQNERRILPTVQASSATPSPVASLASSDDQ